MTGSLGRMSMYALFSVEDLRIKNPEPNVDRVIYEFLRIGEGEAARWIQMPRGVLFLQVAAEHPASGAIYLYDRSTQMLYRLAFDGDDEHLTAEEFDQLVKEYNLRRYAADPGLLQDLPHYGETPVHTDLLKGTSAPSTGSWLH